MNQKGNKSLLDYSKHLKQSKYILEVHAGKDILGHCVENLEEFKNSIVAEEKNKINSKEFNK